MLRAIPLFLAVMFAAPAALALDSGDIVVVSARGEVHVTMKGAARIVRAGAVLELPASLRTGLDGSVELRQGATTVSVGPDTVLDFPSLEKHGAPIDRIQQPRGNAFYNIGKREGRKLRVETPYLVGVVKGTQFNVAARDDATTISLFEGLLEVRASDDSAVVELEAGEIASRGRGDESISVIRMDTGKLPTTAPRPGSGGGSTPDRPGDEVHAPVAVAADVGGASIDVSTGANVSAGPLSADLNASADAGVPNVSANVDAGVSVDAGPVGVELATTADLDVSTSGLSVDNATSVGVDAGLAAVDVATDTSVDVGTSGISTDIGADVEVSAGPLTVDTGTSTSIDLSAGGVTADLTAGTAVDAGLVTADLGTTTAVDIDTGGTVVDTGAALDVAGTDVSAGVSAGVDLGSGAVDLGVSVGNLDLGLGVDLGLGASEPATNTGSSTTPATDTGNTGTVDVGGLLDSLLRRPGRK